MTPGSHLFSTFSTDFKTNIGIPWNPPNSVELELELWHQFQDWNLNWGSIPIPKFANGIGIGIDGIVPMTVSTPSQWFLHLSGKLLQHLSSRHLTQMLLQNKQLQEGLVWAKKGSFWNNKHLQIRDMLTNQNSHYYHAEYSSTIKTCFALQTYGRALSPVFATTLQRDSHQKMIEGPPLNMGWRPGGALFH